MHAEFLDCQVMESWANAEWFTNRPEVPDKVFNLETLDHANIFWSVTDPKGSVDISYQLSFHIGRTHVPFESQVTLCVFKVTGETNTDDLSPAPDAWSRPDIPLHALAMLKLGIQGLNQLPNKSIV